MNQFLKIISVFTLLICCFFSLKTDFAHAAMENAVQLELNKTHQGKLDNSYDSDFYKITLPGDGNVTLSIKHHNNGSWYGTILDNKGVVYENVSTDDSGLVEGYASTQVGLPKGTYYIEIWDQYNSEDISYEIKAGFEESNYYEKEYNDNLTTANTMTLNQL
ncbi:hypothetical protein [Paenisporosarcina sp. OV554]|uniref:hypothetical protein n=1 Tax=Paenisporosarcina sp. OV554 TaxID=2135694 RepID=UPI000D3973A5|nr:hypothetical protein [Paenisporosarcina sp. OV554]PUB17807.1 hypothetical protein C8K15_1011 [Paenisporosarcina sp. OV554]